MTLFERIRFRLQMLRLGFTMKPIAGAEDNPPADPPKTPVNAPDPPAPDKTFTQADLDRIVQERLSRQAKQFEGYDELKEKAKKLDEIEEANRSELDKATRRAEEAEAQATALAEANKKALIRAAVVAEAAKQGAVDPDAVVALLPGDAVTVDDGTVTGAEDAVKALLESKKYLVGVSNASPGPGDGGARTPAQPADLAEQIKSAEAEGDFSKAMSLKNQQLASAVLNQA